MHWVDVRGSGRDCQCGPLSVEGTCGVECRDCRRSDACSLFTEPTIGGRSGLGFGTTTVCDARPNGVRCAFAPSTLGTSFGFPVCRLGSGSTGSAVFAGTIRTRIPRQLASLSGFVSVCSLESRPYSGASRRPGRIRRLIGHFASEGWPGLYCCSFTYFVRLRILPSGKRWKESCRRRTAPAHFAGRRCWAGSAGRVRGAG